jgi:hypothetical protein
MNQNTIALLLLGATSAACHDQRAPSVENFTPAIQAYLAERGELCIGKTEWPIDVTEREAELGTRDAKQLPVFERLGLVSSTAAIAQRKVEEETIEVPVKRYDLTPAGRVYYHARTSRDAQGRLVSHSDFCAAKLSLDQIKSFRVAPATGAPQSAVVFYTYHVAPAPWTADAEAMRVFPAVAHVLAGAGKDELREELTLTPNGWVANELVGATSAPVPTASQASAR